MTSQAFQSSFSDAERCIAQFREDDIAQQSLVGLANRLADVYSSGGKVLVAGNGGSMADAMHFAEEWTGRFRNDRRPFPALAMSDPTHLTCVANDHGYDYVFSRIVTAFAKPEDMVVLISTSGNSQNLVNAAEAATASGAHVTGFLGRGGGRLASLCDTVIMAPGETSDRIQEIHMLALHVLIEVVEGLLGFT